MSFLKTLLVNGASRGIDASTLAEGLETLDYGEAKVATALNGEFVPARARETTPVKDGDRIEIRASAGGLRCESPLLPSWSACPGHPRRAAAMTPACRPEAFGSRGYGRDKPGHDGACLARGSATMTSSDFTLYGVALGLPPHARHVAISLARDPRRSGARERRGDRHGVAPARSRRGCRRGRISGGSSARSACACCPTPPAVTASRRR